MKSEVKKFNINLKQRDFDLACDMAYERATNLFEISASGHAKDDRFLRSCSCLKVEFVNYIHTGSMSGQNMIYTFNTWMESN